MQRNKKNFFVALLKVQIKKHFFSFDAMNIFLHITLCKLSKHQSESFCEREENTSRPKCYGIECNNNV